MRAAARGQEMPVQPHKLTPEVASSFWVNLIGRGYPAPSQKFRWCTERLKIKPSNAFIRGVVQKYGEAILVLGTRKAESQRRAANIERHAARQVRDRLVPNAALTNSLVYTPILRHRLVRSCPTCRAYTGAGRGSGLIRLLGPGQFGGGLRGNVPLVPTRSAPG